MVNVHSWTKVHRICFSVSCETHSKWKFLGFLELGIKADLFSLDMYDLVPEINGLRRGVTISNELTLSILLYVDDVVLISETGDGLQTMLNSIYDWSNRWKLKVNEHKSKVVHFRRVSDDLTAVDFKYGDQELEIVPMYRFLGLDLYTLKRKCLHFDEIFITGCTGSCQNDNFQCSQWLKFRQNDDIFVSVYDTVDFSETVTHYPSPPVERSVWLQVNI